ncbi:hypothetical protein EYF80_017751 [Liparis tanakae]|uniref:Uncharacterized protein n=1 Tax=Liparis tanakae TaxID=230148 RepID=A0A4Z2I403_9TELE|nr:hypothetical protein EYF80_017751 [Liparis tanakae]
MLASSTQSVVSFRHTKQNSTLHRAQWMFLHAVASCTTSRPQVGQARTEGQPVTPFTSSKVMGGQLFRISRGFLHSSFPQCLDQGDTPSHLCRHSQQNVYVYGLLLLAEHTGHSTHRLRASVLITRDLQPGH